MKKVLFGILFLGLTSLGFSQQTEKSSPTVNLDNITVSASNTDYLFTVKDENTPLVVQKLEQKAASYDVTTNMKFDKKSKRPYEIVFKASNGDLVAVYNNKGEILSALENFQNVVLPMSIRKRVFEPEGNWKMDHNQFRSVYHDSKLIKKRYRISLVDGDKRKKVTIDLE